MCGRWHIDGLLDITKYKNTNADRIMGWVRGLMGGLAGYVISVWITVIFDSTAGRPIKQWEYVFVLIGTALGAMLAAPAGQKI